MTLHNKEMNLLLSYSSFIENDIKKSVLDIKFNEIWLNIRKNFEESWTKMKKTERNLNKKFTKNVKEKITRSKYLCEEGWLTKAHDNRMEYIFETIKADKVMIRHQREGIIVRRMSSALKNWFKSSKQIHISEEDESLSSAVSPSKVELDLDNQTEESSEESVSKEASTSKEDWNCSNDSEPIVNIHPAITDKPYMEQIYENYKSKWENFNSKLKEILDKNSEFTNLISAAESVYSKVNQNLPSPLVIEEAKEVSQISKLTEDNIYSSSIDDTISDPDSISFGATITTGTKRGGVPISYTKLLNSVDKKIK